MLHRCLHRIEHEDEPARALYLNFSDVGFFFPSVEPNTTIKAAILPARTKRHGNPDVFVHNLITPPQYTSLCWHPGDTAQAGQAGLGECDSCHNHKACADSSNRLVYDCSQMDLK